MGTLVQDTVRIGSLVVTNQIFAQVMEFPTGSSDPNDGLLGLGFVSISTSGAATVFDNMIAQKQVSEKVFSFYLNRFDVLRIFISV